MFVVGVLERAQIDGLHHHTRFSFQICCLGRLLVVAGVEGRGVLGEAEILPLVCEDFGGVRGVVVVAGDQIADIRQVLEVVDDDVVVQGQRPARRLVYDAAGGVLGIRCLERAVVDGSLHHAGHPGHITRQGIDIARAGVLGRRLFRQPEVEREIGENLVGVGGKVVGSGDVDAGVFVADDDVVGDSQRAAVDNMHGVSLLGAHADADAQTRGQQNKNVSFIHHNEAVGWRKLILEASDGHTVTAFVISATSDCI